MEYLFFGCGIIYFCIIILGIIITPIIYFITTVILSTYWSIKEVREEYKKQ